MGKENLPKTLLVFAERKNISAFCQKEKIVSPIEFKKSIKKVMRKKNKHIG